MKRFVRYVCLVLTMTLLVAIPTFAAETRSSRFFTSSIAYLDQPYVNGRAIDIVFDITATHSMTELGVNYIRVQQSTDRENWVTVKTFTKEDYINLIGKNTCSHAGYVVYNGIKGYYYRAYMELYAKDSTGTAYMPRYTGSMLLA